MLEKENFEVTNKQNNANKQKTFRQILKKTINNISDFLDELAKLYKIIIKFIKTILNEITITTPVVTIIKNLLIWSLGAKIIAGLSLVIPFPIMIVALSKEYLSVIEQLYNQISYIVTTLVNYYKENNETTLTNIFYEKEIQRLTNALEETSKEKQLSDLEIKNLREHNSNLVVSNEILIKRIDKEISISTNESAGNKVNTITSIITLGYYSIILGQRILELFSGNPEVKLVDIQNSINSIRDTISGFQRQSARNISLDRQSGERGPLSGTDMSLEDIDNAS